jgi:hypothetical protein
MMACHSDAPNTADRTVDPASLTLGFVEVIETAPQAGKGVKPVVWRTVTTLPVTKPHLDVPEQHLQDGVALAP